MKRILFHLFCLLHLGCFFANAQQFSFKQYRVENGLPSDIVKACTQDSLGYFWIATDDGLVKYDGIRFTTYREAMHSSFAKGFLTTHDGRLLAFGDLDLLEIQNLGDTVIFKTIRHGSRNVNDSSLSFPKLIYEDVHHNIWVSESQAVVKLGDNTFHRYNFELADRSPQFLRSFSLFEDGRKNMFTASVRGSVFRYNAESDEFEIQAVKLPRDIEFASVLDNKLIIGASGGLYECDLLPEGGFSEPRLKFKISNVAYVTKIQNNNYFIATRDLEDFIGDFTNNTFFPISHTTTNINHAYLSRENDIWLSGNDGLILFKEKLVQEASDHLNHFVEAVAEDPVTGKIFYATNTVLFSFDKTTRKNTVEMNTPGGYFQAIYFAEEGIWMANAFSVYLYKDKKLIKHFDFSKDGRFISDITKDVKGNIWLSQTGNTDVYMVDPALQLKRVKIPLGNEGTINTICSSKDGVYVASTGKKSYLFYKSYADAEFRNISKPVTFTTHGDLNVTDLSIMGNTVWLASSDGLLKFDHEKIERVNLGTTFTELPVKVIKVYAGNQLLISNVYGMMLYDPATGLYDLFNESSGLLSNTIPARGIKVAKDQSVWIGTSKGLCYTATPLTHFQRTPTPRFIDTRINGKHTRVDLQKEIDYGSFISIEVSSVTFPEKEIITQYRFTPDTLWKITSGFEINFSTLKAGIHTLEVRTKKNGPYTWSKVSALSFSIAKPFWQRWWFFLLCALATVLIVLITVLSANARNKKRNRELQRLIAERTNALRVTNEELEHRNAELDRFVYSASHDLSAPLKSVLGLINVAKMESPDSSTVKYLDLMKRSISKLESFIKDIISYSRNSRLEIKKEPVNFKTMIESIWSDLSHSLEADKIKFELVDELKTQLYSDETRLRIIFNNLLSNAIKFRKREGDSYIKVCACENEKYFEFSVQDNGIGISQQYMDKIFEMFFRANETVQGSGLGLYILRETVSKLNGNVKVESKLGEGATFLIYIPK